MEKTDKHLTKNGIVDMQVVDQQGRLVGKVKDLTLAAGKSGISMSVEDEAGKRQNIPWDDVQSATDFILLKPVSTSSVSEQEKVVEPKVQPQEQPVQTEAKKDSTHPLCPTCNQPLTWIPKYKRWYCYNDKKYV